MLSTALRGDKGAMMKAMGDLRAAKRKSRRTFTLDYWLQPLREWIKTQDDDPQETVARFEAAIAQVEKGEGSSSPLEIPDLVTLVGDARAEALLGRALRMPRTKLTVPVGDATRELAMRLAARGIGELKAPPWSLIQGVSPAEVALYEALDRQFPAGEDRYAAYERRQARRLHLLGLIAARRIEEAVRAASEFGEEEPGSRGGLLDERGLHALERGGFARPLHAFLRDLLSGNPALPFWPEFIAVSTRVGEAPAALGLMREIIARPSLASGAREAVQAQLYAALLAADQVEEGARLLRELVAAKASGPAKSSVNLRSADGLRSFFPRACGAPTCRSGSCGLAAW